MFFKSIGGNQGLNDSKHMKLELDSVSTFLPLEEVCLFALFFERNIDYHKSHCGLWFRGTLSNLIKFKKLRIKEEKI